MSCAGHLPPALCHPGQPAFLAEVDADILIGAARPRGRRGVTVRLPAGSVLCLYTDGLVERRGQLLDTGMGALTAALTTAAALEPEACCAALMAAMASHSSRADDTALLVLRRDGADRSAPA
jgi:sigma-B regulation protein RsbU (phosphoserine phosphatase)